MALVKWIHLRKLTPLTELIGGLESGGEDRGGLPAPSARSPTAGADATAELADRRRGPHRPEAPASAPPARREGRQSRWRQRRRTAAPRTKRRTAASNQPDIKTSAAGGDPRQNKSFYGMVIAQAQKVEVEGDSLVFTFAPVHKALQGAARRQARVARAAGAATSRPQDRPSSRRRACRRPRRRPSQGRRAGRLAQQADVFAREPKPTAVCRAVLDVFGGEIEDVEEIK